MDVHHSRRTRHAPGARVHVPLHQGQAVLAKGAGRDVCRCGPGPSSGFAVRRPGAARVALHRSVEDARPRSHGGRGDPQLPDSPATVVAHGRSRSMTTRREFVEACVAVLSSPPGPLSLRERGNARLPIGFSTLGCPAWTWNPMLDFAQTHDYAAIELRGLQKNMDLTLAPELSRDGERNEQSKRELRERGPKHSDLGASAQLHEQDPAKRAAQLDEARRFIDLAE